MHGRNDGQRLNAMTHADRLRGVGVVLDGATGAGSEAVAGKPSGRARPSSA